MRMPNKQLLERVKRLGSKKDLTGNLDMPRIDTKMLIHINSIVVP